mmetsp:Transcript_63213/g.159436  ORF Transcript_63213/g.159436 Transcript_63213/m.159436 type:complete len:82 (+) Transcript_63213:1617-1862(+)
MVLNPCQEVPALVELFGTLDPYGAFHPDGIPLVHWIWLTIRGDRGSCGYINDHGDCWFDLAPPEAIVIPLPLISDPLVSGP